MIAILLHELTHWSWTDLSAVVMAVAWVLAVKV
jgi:hypothetical protein